MKSSIIKNFGIGVILAVVLYTATFYFQEFNRANEFNEFLEDASTISELHSTNAVNFREILYFFSILTLHLFNLKPLSHRLLYLSTNI